MIISFFHNESTEINLYKAKSKNFYNLFNVMIHTEDQTRPKRWSEKLSLNKDVTKKELFRFGIRTDDECLYCGDKH